MEYLSEASKLIATSLVALFVIAIGYRLLPMIRLVFRKSLRYTVFILALIVFAFAAFIIWQLGYIQLGSILNFVSKRIVGELLISVVLVVSFVGTQIIVDWARSVSLAGIPSLNRLRLVGVPRVESLNQILVQWDDEKISYEKVLDEQILHSLRKSIKKNDDTGWLELEELTKTSWKSPTGRQALVLMSRELWNLEQLNVTQAPNDDVHKCEVKLKSLLPHYAVAPMNELIGQWEDGFISDEEVKDAMLLSSFKKLIVDEDEVGLYELKAHFPDEKLKIQQIAETELWYLNRARDKKTTSEQDEETKLSSLLTFV